MTDWERTLQQVRVIRATLDETAAALLLGSWKRQAGHGRWFHGYWVGFALGMLLGWLVFR